MSKIAPPVSPQVPRSLPKDPGAAPAGQPPPGAQPQAAESSARKLASELIKGGAKGAPTARGGTPDKAGAAKGRAERPSVDGERPRGESSIRADSESSGRGGQGGAGTSEQGLLGSTFAALKRARLDKANKARRKKATGTRAVDSKHLDDEDEDVLHRPAVRTWLRGEDNEENAFDQARREARLLDEMERQGEPPPRILSQLNEQLSGARGPQFKDLLVYEVRPQLERMADQVPELPTDERRKVAALISRAAHLAGRDNAVNFASLLSSTATAEADHLGRVSGTGVMERGSEFQAALRRAASPAYRDELVERSQAHLEKLAADAMRAPIGDLQAVLTSLLNAAESMGARGSTTMAEAFVRGALVSKQEVAGALSVALGVALPTMPGGGVWAVRLMGTFAARGEDVVAWALCDVLQRLLRDSRERCVNRFRGVQLTQDPARLEEEWRQLETAGATLAGLLPACAALVEARAKVPGEEEGELVTEALLGLATLDLVGATPTGQRVLRHAVLLQEQGEPLFLRGLPRLMPLLAQPRLLQGLSDSGLSALHFQYGGGTFIQKVGVQLGRALMGPLLARSQKGDSAEARRLLVSAIEGNAALFGLSLQGGRLASGLLEVLRSKPNPTHVQRYMTRLEKVARVHPSMPRAGAVESLRGLVTALAERDPRAAPRSSGHRLSLGAAPTLTTLEMEASHVSLVRTRELQREAAARAAATPPPASRPAPVARKAIPPPAPPPPGPKR